MLKPAEKTQNEFFCGGLADILFRVSDGKEAVFCLPGSDNCFEPSAHYGIDGVTEKVCYGTQCQLSFSFLVKIAKV